jgi:hypothetical protein
MNLVLSRQLRNSLLPANSFDGDFRLELAAMFFSTSLQLCLFLAGAILEAKNYLSQWPIFLGPPHPTGDLTKWTHAPGAADTASADNSHGDTRRAPLSAAGSPRDAVAPLVQQVGDSVPPSEPSQIIINSGAGSRAQLFNRGPRIEHTATVPPASAPVEVLPAAPSAPSADTPQPQPYDGPGSRARLFRNQPRN